MVNTEGIIVLLVLIAITVGLIFLQYKLCSVSNGKKAGLILPIVSFAISVICTVSVLSMMAVKTSYTGEVYDEYGNVIGTEEIKTEDTDTSVIPAAAGCFLFTNIPTIIYLIEYSLIISGKKKSELEAAEMAKTQIQDL